MPRWLESGHQTCGGPDSQQGTRGFAKSHSLNFALRTLPTACDKVNLSHFVDLWRLRLLHLRSGQFKCFARNSNVPLPLMVCGPLKNSISVLSPKPSCTYWRRVLANS